MNHIIKSAGGIVYRITDDGPAYLMIKRHAKSWKIERVAPKGKLQDGESNKDAALREISEETWLPLNQLKLWQHVGMTQLRSTDGHGTMNKDVDYFVVEYTGPEDAVRIIEGEWYLGNYIWADIQRVIELVYYRDMRELMREAHLSLTKQGKNDKVKAAFMKKLD